MASTEPDEHGRWEDELEQLEGAALLAGAWLDDAIGWLAATHQGTSIAHVLDVGSGPGVATCAFAQSVPTATVTALDPTPRVLERTRERAAQLGVADRVITVEGDLGGELPVHAPADLVWASHVLHHLADPGVALRRLRGLLADDGRVAVVEGGLPARVLPGAYGVGRPGFASRLDAAMSEYWAGEWELTDTAIGGARDWPVLLSDAGLVGCRSRTFLVDLPAPVDERLRQQVISHHRDVREHAADRLAVDDVRALDVLLDEDDPRSLARRPDLFVLTAFTVHVGSLPADA